MKYFILSIALALLALAGVLYWTNLSASDRLLTNADQNLATRARISADAIDRALQQRMVEVFTFAALPSLRAFTASAQDDRPARMAVANVELRAIASADPSVRAAAIIDANGIVILATDSTANQNWSSRLFVRAAMQGQLYASVPVREFGEVSQYYSAPVIDNAGNVAGELVVRVAAQEMWAALSGQADVMLIDENGVRIADQSAAPQPFVALEPLTATVIANIYANQTYGMEIAQIRATNLTDLASAIRNKKMNVMYLDAQGKTIYAAMAQIKTNPWTIVTTATQDSILASAQENLVDQFRTMLITAFVVVCAIVAAFLMSSIKAKSNAATE